MKENKIILVIVLVLFVVGIIFIPKQFSSNDSNSNYNSNNAGENEQEKEELEIDGNIVKIDINPLFGQEPNLDFLAESSTLIVRGKINISSINYEVRDDLIYTTAEILVNGFIKNSLDIDESTKVWLHYIGGKLSASDYIEALSDEAKERYSLSKEQMETLTFSLDASNGELNLLDENAEYLFFLIRDKNDWGTNSFYYGIRKIEGNQVYDYDTDSYVDTSLLN